MEIHKPQLDGLILFKPQVFRDERGYFFENFRKSNFESAVDIDFVQENESMSNAGIVRGLHLQAPPYAQAKLVRVIKGAILDVVVDVRKKSPTFGQHFSIELNETNKWSFFIPAGFAHGFFCLEDQTIVQYKCSEYYHPESEMGFKLNDPLVGIDWPNQQAVESKKDKALPSFQDFKSPF